MEKLKIKLKAALARAARVKRYADEDGITLYAAKASYFVLLSAIPIVMLFVLAAGAVFPLDAREIADITAEFLPDYMAEFGNRVLSEVFIHTNIPLFSLSAIALLWASSRGIRSVGDGLQNVFGDNGRGYIRDVALSIAYTLGFIVVMALTLAVLVFGKPIQTILDGYFEKIPSFIHILVNFRNPIFICILTFMFMAAYSGLARSGIPFAKHFYGALLAAGGWLLFSYLFSAYITYFTRTSYIYGSLAAIIVFMLWLYICMIILLLGAEFNKRRFEARRRKEERRGDDAPNGRRI